MPKVIVTEIAGKSIDPVFMNYSIRGKHNKKWKKRRPTVCCICKERIQIGEAYLYCDTFSYCQLCVTIDILDDETIPQGSV